MSKPLQWIGKNLSLGGLVRHASNATGTVARVAASGTGSLIAPLIAGNPDEQAALKAKFSSAGTAIDNAVTKGGGKAGDFINYSIQKVSQGTGAVTGHAVKAMGGTEQQVQVATRVGNVVGAAGAGLIIGVGIADADRKSVV